MIGGTPAAAGAGRPDSSDGHSGLPGDARCDTRVPRLAGPQRVLISVTCGKAAVAFYRFRCAVGHVRCEWCCPVHLPEVHQAECRQCFVRDINVPMTAQLVRRV